MSFEIHIWHNILWARYRAQVFSELYRLATEANDRLSVFHIAKTETSRAALSDVDATAHAYPYECLFDGAYSAVPTWRIALALARRALTSHADMTIIAGYDKTEYWVQALILRMRGKNIGVFCASTILDRPQTPLKGLAKRMFFKMCSCALAYGTRSKEYLEAMGMPGDIIFTNCQAAAVPAEYTPERVRLLRAESKPQVPTILYVGRLSPEKELDTVLRAMPKVLERTPSARLLIVGSGPQQAELLQLAATLGVDGNVDFAGPKPPETLWSYYLGATCLVLASRREPWGQVVSEALTLGLPVVVSDRCGCVTDMVVEGVTGYSFPCGDADALAARLTDVLTIARDGDALSEGALRTISNFSPTAAAQSMYTGIRIALSGTKR